MKIVSTTCGMLVAGFLATSSAIVIGAEPTGVQSTTVVIRPIPLSSAAQQLPAEVKRVIADELKQRFGDGVTFVHSEQLPIEFGEANTKQRRERGWLLTQGQNVFNKNCLECHGQFGDGQASTEKKLHTHPRDFRKGVFKWKSTKPEHKPSRHDLDQTILLGLPGTNMPGFGSLSDDERRGVVEYVRWMSMRHDLEWRVVQTGQEADAEDIRNDLGEYFKVIADGWKKADMPESAVQPKVIPNFTADHVARGKALYLGDKTKCFVCHGMEARGDGTATKDFWYKPGTKERYQTAGMHDDWGNKLTPRDFTSEPLRGGEDGIEIFRRISVGISGAPMPAYGSILSEDEKWDLVAFVLSLRPAKVEAVHREPSPKSRTK